MLRPNAARAVTAPREKNKTQKQCRMKKPPASTNAGGFFMRNVGPSGSVQCAAFRQVGVADFDAEKARAATAAADFFFGGFAHAFDRQVQSDRDT